MQLGVQVGLECPRWPHSHTGAQILAIGWRCQLSSTCPSSGIAPTSFCGNFGLWRGWKCKLQNLFGPQPRHHIASFLLCSTGQRKSGPPQIQKEGQLTPLPLVGSSGRAPLRTSTQHAIFRKILQKKETLPELVMQEDRVRPEDSGSFGVLCLSGISLTLRFRRKPWASGGALVEWISSYQLSALSYPSTRSYSSPPWAPPAQFP